MYNFVSLSLLIGANIVQICNVTDSISLFFTILVLKFYGYHFVTEKRICPLDTALKLSHQILTHLMIYILQQSANVSALI